MSGSLENSSFPRKQPVTNFGSNAHAWLALIGFHVKDESMQKVLVNDFFARKEKKKKKSRNEKLSYLGAKLNFITHFM